MYAFYQSQWSARSIYIIHPDKLSKQLGNVRHCERVHALVPSINLF